MVKISVMDTLYDEYRSLESKSKDKDKDNIKTNLLQYGITQEYYNEVDHAAGLLLNFYCKYLMNDDTIHQAVYKKTLDNKAETIKFFMLIDVMRCYDGLDHPTSFTTPEGIAFMIFISKILGIGEINTYRQLEGVGPTTIALLDLIPYIDECSHKFGNRYSLLISEILGELNQEDADRLYRLLMYNLCKKIAEVDGVITPAEQDWLNEIARLNDDDPNNDIDVSKL